MDSKIDYITVLKYLLPIFVGKFDPHLIHWTWTCDLNVSFCRGLASHFTEIRNASVIYFSQENVSRMTHSPSKENFQEPENYSTIVRCHLLPDCRCLT